MALIKGVRRLQGFIVEKGNPKNIKDFKDLEREDVIYINRQRGAGTRILLDYHLKSKGINPTDIKGYQREMTTHMAVATAVKTKTADVGLGIYSAAKALHLEFIELAYEDYDFLIYQDMLDNPQIKEFINLLKSKEFQQRVLFLGGYEVDNIGHIIKI